MIDPTLPRTLADVRGGIRSGLHIGAQLYVSLRGQVIADAAVGNARPGRSDAPAAPMTRDTILVWLSAGKPLTAVAVGQLADAGKLAFDDTVARHIPEFATHGKEAVTLRHLLTHTAGMRTIHTDWPRATWEETLATLCAAEMEKDWPPGQKAGYHAFTTWYLLGEVVRRVDGRPIAQYLREAIFEPLGMSDSWLSLTREQYDAYQPRLGELQRIIGTSVSGYSRAESMNLDTAEAAQNPRPAGGIRGPVRELGIFYEAMLRAVRGESMPGRAVLSTDVARQMTAHARSGMFDQSFKAVVDWGLGFQLNSEHLTPNAPYNFGPYASRATFGHGGFQAGVGMCDPEKSLVVAVLFNGCPGESKHLARIRRFFASLYEELGLV